VPGRRRIDDDRRKPAIRECLAKQRQCVHLIDAWRCEREQLAENPAIVRGVQIPPHEALEHRVYPGLVRAPHALEGSTRVHLPGGESGSSGDVGLFIADRLIQGVGNRGCWVGRDQQNGAFRRGGGDRQCASNSGLSDAALAPDDGERADFDGGREPVVVAGV
jgi:hypothetical protein